MEKHRCNEEIRIIRERQQRIDKELKRLQAKATKKPLEIEKDYKKFLRKLRNEAKFGRELLTSVSSSSSTEDNTGDEEEH
ncbi:protein FAM227B [Pipistrellus kuhlii]|uniref:protein FAM227B n=1 Tax=Pipistrellus kuhlii TaxID=59472 RepID=UPI001E2707A9|nr:protein FAM227B [Pipistrellus kuhlii]